MGRAQSTTCWWTALPRVNSYYPDLNADLAVDAVQEFKVQSGSMSAEYGFTLGGVINVATKSGTNGYHGTLTSSCATMFSMHATPSPARHPIPLQPIRTGVRWTGENLPKYNGRNKTFVFGNWEAVELHPLQPDHHHLCRSPSSATATFRRNFDATGKLVPIYDPARPWSIRTEAAMSATFRQQHHSCVAAGSGGAEHQQVFYPLPNRTPSNSFTNANNYHRHVDATPDMQQYTDAHRPPLLRPGARSSAAIPIFGITRQRDIGTVARSRGARPLRQLSKRATPRSRETHTFSPTVLNEIRVGTARQYFPFQAAALRPELAAKLGFPSNVPSTTIPAHQQWITGVQYTDSDCVAHSRGIAIDTVTVVHGAHS